MSGDWIKVRKDLTTDPVVFRIGRLLDMDPFAVVGRLAAFWAWVGSHSVDGYVDAAVDADVDSVCHADGFASALVDVGWLEYVDGGLRVPDFEAYNSGSAKSRSSKSERQARWRAKKAILKAQAGDGLASTGSRSLVDACVDAVASTEKGREEKSINTNTPLPPSADAAGGAEMAPVDSAAPLAGRKRAKRQGVQPQGITAWLAQCRADDLKPIPPDDPALAYAAKVGLPRDVVGLHWAEFKARHVDSAKRYRDWRKAFLNSLRGNWYGLWFIGADGVCTLSTKGVQAQRAHADGQAARDGGDA